MIIALSFVTRTMALSQASRSSSTMAFAASRRVRGTDAPIIVTMKELMKGKKDVLSLAQGVVHWEPPEKAMAMARSSEANSYGPAAGTPALVEALTKKIHEENGLTSKIMTTAGANQGYTNLVLALLDAGDRGAIFAPFYFNHKMAIEMTGAVPLILPTDSDYFPRLDKLEEAFNSDDPPKMVTVVNPANPTGVLVPGQLLEDIRDLCARHGAFLVVDNTYEYFDWIKGHTCVEGDHVINVFSLSKAYGAMGWRLGYLAYPEHLQLELEKIQDTIVICPTGISQAFAVGCLDAGRPWVDTHMQTLLEPRQLLRDALESALGSVVSAGTGAIYYLADIGETHDDFELARRLIDDYGVAVIPGSSCGAPGTIRVCYSNLPVEKCRTAADRLYTGVTKILR